MERFAEFVESSWTIVAQPTPLDVRPSVVNRIEFRRIRGERLNYDVTVFVEIRMNAS
jgi:hypothetical protein